MQWPSPGYNNTPSYQTSGLPYLTTSSGLQHLTFPMVTKFITITATGGATKFGFSADGFAGTNYFTIASGQTQTFDFRVKEMWVSGAGAFGVAAGLTDISAVHIPSLTGSYAYNPSDPYFTGSNAYINFLVYPGV